MIPTAMLLRVFGPKVHRPLPQKRNTYVMKVHHGFFLNKYVRQSIINHFIWSPVFLKQSPSTRIKSSVTNNMDSNAGIIRQVFEAGVEAVSPVSMVTDALRITGDQLTVGQKVYTLKNNVYIVAFGKAVSGMIRAAEDALGGHVVEGIGSVPNGNREAMMRSNNEKLLPSSSSKVRLIEGARNNLPDEDALVAAEAISQLIKKLTENDILLVLISGGGSALLPSPIPPITLEEKQFITQELGTRGASIQELNTVRKHLSNLKGGKLAQLAYPSQIIALMISDIIGDTMEFIASGPTIPDTTTAHDCKEILLKFVSKDKIPQSILEALDEEKRPCSRPKEFPWVQNVIVGCNNIAMQTSSAKAREVNFTPIMLSASISGEASTVGETYAKIAFHIDALFMKRDSLDHHNSLVDVLKGLNIEGVEQILSNVEQAILHGLPLCLLGAGETTVTLKGIGKGGRNQEMVLSAAMTMHKLWDKQRDCCDIMFLSAGTDGQDGPTDAAGAIAYPTLVDEALSENIDPQNYIQNNDSYTFFSIFNGGQFLLKTGLTGTNVMDIQILTISPRG